ncbi:MAG: ferric reductase-like transmembrane domain-containing protein [Mycobacteriales bacterium]
MTDLLTDPQLSWFVARASGFVGLALITLSLVLGIGSSTRMSSAGWPRFVTQALHRDVSLFVLVLLAVHVFAVILDDYVTITIADSLIPFVASYRPVWLGLGVLSADLFVALVVSSELRHRLGYGAWRAVHWTAYACWPLAIVHSLGTGSDTRRGWAVWFVVGCVLLVLLAVAWRIVEGWPRRAVLRAGAVIVTACTVAMVLTWAKQGPLAPGWSKRSGPPPAAGTR